MFSRCKLNTIGDEQHPYLTPFSIFVLLVSPWSSRTLTLWFMYKVLINLLLRKLISVPFRICINLVQFTRSNAFCQSMTQAHNSSSMSKVRSDIILSITIASLVPFLLLNPNWSFPSKSSIFFSILLQNILTIIFSVCAMRLTVRWSLQFVAFGFIFKAVILAWMKSLGHSSVSHMLLISYVVSLRPSSPKNLSASPGTSSSSVAFFKSHLIFPFGIL
jgi:hypothetical protein